MPLSAHAILATSNGPCQNTESLNQLLQLRHERKEIADFCGILPLSNLKSVTSCTKQVQKLSYEKSLNTDFMQLTACKAVFVPPLLLLTGQFVRAQRLLLSALLHVVVQYGDDAGRHLDLFKAFACALEHCCELHISVHR